MLTSALGSLHIAITAKMLLTVFEPRRPILVFKTFKHAKDHCVGIEFAIILQWKTTWISRRWFCTFFDTYSSILHIFFSWNTSLFAQDTSRRRTLGIRPFAKISICVIFVFPYQERVIMDYLNSPYSPLFSISPSSHLPSLRSFSHQSIYIPIRNRWLPWYYMILPWLPSSLFLFSFVSSSFSLSYGIEYRY